MRTVAIAGALGLLMTGIGLAASPSPAPLACPNAAQYTEAGTKCAQAEQAGDTDSEETLCRNAALQAGECAHAETGLAALDDIGNEASFAMMTGVATHAQHDGAAVDWLRVAMALYRRLYEDPSSPANVRAAAHKHMNDISQLPWYVDGPPPSSPPGEPAPPGEAGPPPQPPRSP